MDSVSGCGTAAFPGKCAPELRAAHRALGKQEATDDCQAVELNGGTVKIVTNFRPNFKITTVEDLQAAGAMLK